MGNQNPNSTASAGKGPNRRSIPAAQRLARVKARNKRIALLSVSACLLVLLVAGILVGGFFLMQEPEEDDKILSNVVVAGINIGDMTIDEARSALMLGIGNSFSTENMVVTLPGETLVISPEVSRAELDLDELLADAYAYGRTGSTLEKNIARINAKDRVYSIALLPYLNLDLDNIMQAVEDFCDGYSITLTQPKVELIGERPQYTPADSAATDEDQSGITGDDEPAEPQPPQVPEVVHQVLVITMGTPKFELKAHDLYDYVLDAYSMHKLSVSYKAPTSVEPEIPDAQAIFDLYCTAAKDATIDNKTFAVTPEVYGYGFDVESAAVRINRAGYGEQIRITLEFLLPDITAKALAGDLFQDILAIYTSSSGGTYNANRNKNLQVVCNAINGYVIKSGESFDLNSILGPRTKDAGYLSAPNFTGSTTSSVGGGISQVSSALHYCALLSGLQIDERHAHNYAVPYSPMGTDANITYGGENLVFTNNTSDPIRIVATANGDRVTIQFHGTDEKEFLLLIDTNILNTVEPLTVYKSMTEDNVLGYRDGRVLQTGIMGYEVETILYFYDKQTGELVSQQVLSTSNYAKRDQIVVRIEQSESSGDEEDDIVG